MARGRRTRSRTFSYLAVGDDSINFEMNLGEAARLTAHMAEAHVAAPAVVSDGEHDPDSIGGIRQVAR